MVKDKLMQSYPATLMHCIIFILFLPVVASVVVSGVVAVVVIVLKNEKHTLFVGGRRFNPFRYADAF